MSKLDLDGPLWRFALEFYALPSVAEACLSLQDEAGLDVIQLLVATYADLVLRQPLSVADVAELGRQTTEWRTATVLPLRDIRRVLKAPRDGFPEERQLLREKVKAAELLAEQIQLAMTGQWLSQREPGPGLPMQEVLGLLLKNDAAQQGSELMIGIALSALATARDTIVRNRDMTGNPGDS
jgi:uncharacterized protein (TIGR02444 family)